eukprot:3836045-Amphidinium_carterae.1
MLLQEWRVEGFEQPPPLLLARVRLVLVFEFGTTFKFADWDRDTICSPGRINDREGQNFACPRTVGSCRSSFVWPSPNLPMVSEPCGTYFEEHERRTSDGQNPSPQVVGTP